MNKVKALIKKPWVKWSLITIASIFLSVLLLYSAVYFGLYGKLPDNEQLSSLRQAEATQVLDMDGKLIGKYYIYDRQPLKFDDFPKHLIEALVATEDIRFYDHNGIDNRSLLRVAFKNFLLGNESAGGGSTITMQLVKNLYGREDYKFMSIVINKFKESIVARRIESLYSKDEILTQYLNTVPFPDNTYGVESAARKFFDKTTSELSISEAATLVGTLKATQRYNPRTNVERSQIRRNVVLNQMAKYGYLATKDIEEIKKDSVVLNYKHFDHDLGLAPYFREQVKKEVQHALDTITKPNGEPYNIYNDGLIIHTTLDSGMQSLAEEAMKEHMSDLQDAFEKSYGDRAPWLTNKKLVDEAIKKLDIYKSYVEAGLSPDQIEDSLNVKRELELFDWKENIIKEASIRDSIQHYLKLLNSGMIAIAPTTGAIRSYIGGIDYRYFQYDHVSQSERQVGSTFKPLVYTAAIENGMDPCTYFSLAEVTYTNYNNWTPSNSTSNEDFDPHLNYNLETAFSKSVNTIAVKILNKVGLSNVINQAEKMGLKSTLPREPSLALGVAEISVSDLSGAFASYLNNGKGVKPMAIARVEDRNGNTILSFEPEIMKTPAFSNYTSEILLEMMKSTVNQGTAVRIRSVYKLDNDIAGKTGTTQENKDGWFVGLTPNLVTVTWVGNDNHAIGFSNTNIGQGANSALPIFAKFYQKLNQDPAFSSLTNARFKKPSANVLADLNCEPEKRDGFFKRLFSRDKKKKKFDNK